MHDQKQQQLIAWVGTHILPHEAGIRAWLSRRVSPNEADDIVQECYCRVAELQDVSHIRSPVAYFRRIARNVLNDQMRRARVVRIEAVSDPDIFEIEFAAPSPERVALGRRELERVLRLMAALPERTRRVLELRKIHCLPQREVARLMNISEGVVENEVIRGQRTILRMIAQGEAISEEAFATEGNSERATDRP